MFKKRLAWLGYHASRPLYIVHEILGEKTFKRFIGYLYDKDINKLNSNNQKQIEYVLNNLSSFNLTIQEEAIVAEVKKQFFSAQKQILLK